MAKRAPGSVSESDARRLDASCKFIVLTGDESFLRQLHTTALKAELVKAFGEVDVVQFDGQSASAADVLDECRSFGLIATYKLVVVDNADEVVKEESRLLFERYAQGLIDAKGEFSATLLLRCKTWRAGNLDKLIAEVGTILKCEALPEEKAIGWAIVRCRKQHKGEIEHAAAALLVARVGGSLGRIDSELGKLSAAAGNDASGKPVPITPTLVGEFVGLSREEEIWGIQGTLLASAPAAALAALADAIEVSRHPPALIFFAMTDLARKLHAASHGVRQGLNAWQLKGPLKLWGSSADAIVGMAGKIQPADARRLLQATLSNMARDRSSLGDSVRTLERTTLEFSSPR